MGLRTIGFGGTGSKQVVSGRLVWPGTKLTGTHRVDPTETIAGEAAFEGSAKPEPSILISVPLVPVARIDGGDCRRRCGVKGEGGGQRVRLAVREGHRHIHRAGGVSRGPRRDCRRVEGRGTGGCGSSERDRRPCAEVGSRDRQLRAAERCSRRDRERRDVRCGRSGEREGAGLRCLAAAPVRHDHVDVALPRGPASSR